MIKVIILLSLTPSDLILVIVVIDELTYIQNSKYPSWLYTIIGVDKELNKIKQKNSFYFLTA